MEIWNDFLIKWLSDLSRLKLGITPCYFNELHHSMTNLVSRANIEKIYALYDEIIALNVWATHPLNHKLQLENFLFKYQQIYA